MKLFTCKIKVGEKVTVNWRGQGFEATMPKLDADKNVVKYIMPMYK